MEGAEALAGPDAPFDRAVVFLEDVVQVPDGAAAGTGGPVSPCFFNSPITLGIRGFVSTLITCGRG